MSLRPRNAGELLEAFISYGKNKRYAVDQQHEKDPSLTPITLIPDDLSVVEAIRGETPVKEWIASKIIRPGLTVSSKGLTESQKTCFINVVKTQILSKELHRAFGHALKRLDSAKKTVHEYSRELVDVILNLKITTQDSELIKDVEFESVMIHDDHAQRVKKLSIATDSNLKDCVDSFSSNSVFRLKTGESFSRSRINNSITSILIANVLSAPLKKELCDSAVRIAHIHRIDGGEGLIYFACFFDPVINALSLCTMDEDGGNLRPQNEEEWVANIPWELYGVRRQPTLDKRELKQIQTV